MGSHVAPVKEFSHSSFLVFRTPLLPLNELLHGSSDLVASTVLEEGGNLEAAVQQDVALLRKRLEQIISRPEVRDALFVASPDLDDSLQHWITQPESEKGRRVE